VLLTTLHGTKARLGCVMGDGEEPSYIAEMDEVLQ